MTNDTIAKNIRTVSSGGITTPLRRQDGRQQARKLVGGDKVNLASGGQVTQSGIANNAVGAAQWKSQSVTVTITAGASSGTGTGTSGATIVGFYPSGNCDQVVKNVSLSASTVTVNLIANATNTTTIIVMLLLA